VRPVASASERLGHWLRRGAVYGALLTVSAIIVAPFAWLVLSTIRPADELYASPLRWLPETVTLEAYGAALRTLARPLLNSALYGVLSAVLSLLIAVPAAYSLARYRYRGKHLVSGALLTTQMLPMVLLLIPLYLVYARIGLYDTVPGLIVAYSALTVPFSILLLRGFFLGLPRDLEEQAMVDGCSRLGALRRIVLPLSGPAIAATALLAIVVVWNDVLVTVFLTSGSDVQTASVALYNLFNVRAGALDRVILLAGGVLLTLPVVVLFMFLQRYLVRGVTLGAVR
jgi:ABC-type glycerol-3-phosphate transport system permease component